MEGRRGSGQLALAQRAWLTVSSIKFHLINNFPTGAGIVVFGEYVVANIGHSVAQDISINTSLFFANVDNVTDKTVRDLCDRPRHEMDAVLGSRSGFSTTILPAQTELVSGFPTPAAEFARANANDGIDTNTLNKIAPHFGLIPILTGCITYKSILDEQWHHTGFAFQAGLQSGDVPYQADMFPGTLFGIQIDVGQKGPVQLPKGLHIFRFPAGNFAD